MDYLLKSTICLTAFYSLYFFGFRRMSFHTLNRFYLLASLALSLTIPLLSYERTEVVVLESQPIEEVSIPVEEMQESAYNQSTVIQPTTSIEEISDKTIDWIQIMNTIYLLGVGVMMFVFVKNLLTVLYTIKKASVSVESLASCGTPPATVASTLLSHRRSHRKLKILLTKSQSNSSFFNYVFLNPDKLNPHEEALIIAHEGFHAQRLHTLDLLLLGILKAVFWFNPIVYFYQKSLKQIHEYEVDALMSATYDGREYAHLLLKLGVAPSALIINQFSTKPLSERIQFLFKTPTKNMKKLLYFLSLPLIAVGVMAFAEEKVVRVYKEKLEQKNISKSFSEIEVLPAEKSTKKEVIDTLTFEKISKIDSSRFTYYASVKVGKNNIDSFKVIVNNRLMIEGEDFIVKNNSIYLDQKYKSLGSKISYWIYVKSNGPIIYPELTKLDEIAYPSVNKSTPIFTANKNNTNFLYNYTKPKTPTPFSKVAKNQDTLRTILETNKLGKNPLVFVNGEEYPSSILYRINPDEVTGTSFYPPNNMSGIEGFGEAARDGVIKITTKGEDFIIKNDKQHKIAIENVRMRLIESKKRVRRQIYQNSNGVKYEEISFQSSTIGGTYGYSVKLPRGQKVVFFLDGKLVSEEEINNSKQPFTVNVSKDEKLNDKYSEELKSVDVIFNLKSKQD